MAQETISKSSYSEAKDILFRGFICAAAEIETPEGLLPVVFKSLAPREYELIRMTAGAVSKGNLSHATYLTLLHSVFILDGENILDKREKYFPRILAALKVLPAPDMRKIMSEVINLARRQSSLHDLVYRFVYSDDSRAEWRVTRNRVMDPLFTGIAGTGCLGLNDYQKFWVLFNSNEDLREQNDLLFRHCLFILSAVNPKEVGRIREKMEADAHAEQERRKSLVAGEDPKVMDEVHQGIKTVAQLQEELDRAIRGEKDFHDLIIDEYERKLKEKIRVQIQKELDIRDRIQRDGLDFLQSSMVYGEKPNENQNPGYSQSSETNDEIEAGQELRVLRHIGDRKADYQKIYDEELKKRHTNNQKKDPPKKAPPIESKRQEQIYSAKRVEKRFGNSAQVSQDLSSGELSVAQLRQAMLKNTKPPSADGFVSADTREMTLDEVKNTDFPKIKR